MFFKAKRKLDLEDPLYMPEFRTPKGKCNIAARLTSPRSEWKSSLKILCHNVMLNVRFPIGLKCWHELHLSPVILQLPSLQVSGHATTPPSACWPRNSWVWLPSRPMEFLIWTGPPRSWRSRRDASMTSPTSWRECSSSVKSPRTTFSGCEYNKCNEQIK